MEGAANLDPLSLPHRPQGMMSQDSAKVGPRLDIREVEAMRLTMPHLPGSCFPDSAQS
jgi:hypothetical protein